MSGFYLLALIAVWLLLGWILFRIWRSRKTENLTRGIVHVVIGVLLFAIWFGGAFWEVTGKKLYWDAKVRELCAKDGGVKVYEIVELPPVKFNKFGQINFYHPTQGENALGPEYLVKVETRFLRAEDEDPVIMRFQSRVFRQSDGKLLAESISYARRGGDIPGPWHPSSFHCPDHAKDVLDELFVKSKSIEGRKK